MAEYALIDISQDPPVLKREQFRDLDGPIPDLSHKGLKVVPVVRTPQSYDPNLSFRREWSVTVDAVTETWIPEQKTGQDLVRSAFREFERRQSAFAPSQEEINAHILKILHLAVTGQMASITNAQKNAAKYIIDLHDAYKALKTQIEGGATPDVADDVNWPPAP